MDFSAWPMSSGQSDRKRTYQQMQRSHNNPPQFPSSFTSLFSSPPSNRPSTLQNNNHPSTSNTNPSTLDAMADRTRHRTSMRASPYQPPSLQHRTSQTVIDLTGDSDEPPSPRPTRSFSQRRTQRPPRLGRDDILGADEPNRNVLIDLTAEADNQSEADLELVEVLQRQPVIPRPPNLPHRHHHHHHHHHHRGLDLRRPAGLSRAPVANVPSRFPPHEPNEPQQHGQGNIARLSHQIHRAMMAAMPVHGHQGFLGFLSAGEGPQELNVALNYDALAFGGPPAPPEQQKTPHVPPKPAQEGFTRSPAALDKDEILICPACEEELIQHHSDEPPPTTNAKGKALTDKERAEHPFWVVRKCGHVFCNKCYQDRKNKNGDSKFFLPDRPKTEKTLICPVEDCTSAVSKPAEWIGIFL